MINFCDVNGRVDEVSINGDGKVENICDKERKTGSYTINRIRNGKKKEKKDSFSESDVEESVNRINKLNRKHKNGNKSVNGKEEGGSEEEKEKVDTENKKEEEEELYSLPSDMDLEYYKSKKTKETVNTNANEDSDDDGIFFDVSDECDGLLNGKVDGHAFYEHTGKGENSRKKQNNNSVEKQYIKNNKNNDQTDNKGKKKSKHERRKTSQLMNLQFSDFKNFDLHEQIRSTIELCVPKIKSSKEMEDKMLVNMEKISNIHLRNITSRGEPDNTELHIGSLYENVDHILDATNKLRLEKEREINTSIHVGVNPDAKQERHIRTNEESGEVVEIKKNMDLMNSLTQEQIGNKIKSDSNWVEGNKGEDTPPNVDYYLKSSMVELNECIQKLFSGCCDFKERNTLTQKITNIVPELNNLYVNKNLCYIKDNPSVTEIAHIVPGWKNSFEKMNRRALGDTEDMIHILKRIKNMKNDLYMLNKDLIEDREEFENIKFETVEQDAAVTLIESKNKKYIKGALKLDNMGQKLKKAFNIPTNPLTNFTISEHINRLLNYEEELLMGNDFFGKYSKHEHFEILRFKNNNKKFELFEKEDGEACYVIDMLISDLKRVYEEKKKEFEKIDKKMKLYELTDINKFKGFMDITLNSHNVCINEFKESIREAIIALFDIYENCATKNLKVKKIEDTYIKHYVSKDILRLNYTEKNKKKEKKEEKYFMSLNFTRKKPIDHPFFIYHCLSPTFMLHFVNFIINPECLENQKNFMQHCSIPGFNSVVFCQQILKLKKQEKEFTNNDYSYDFSTAYSKVLCADLCSVVLKSFNGSISVEEHTGENKYLTALKNASDDFFQNVSKKKINVEINKSINNTASVVTSFFNGPNTTQMSPKPSPTDIFYNININSNDTVDTEDGTVGFQLLHYIPDELTNISNKQTAMYFDDSGTNGEIYGSIKNYDLNKFNILKVSPHPILSNVSNELLHRKMKQEALPFMETCNGFISGTNGMTSNFMMPGIPTVSNMSKDNTMGSKGENIFTVQNGNILGNNTSLFNKDRTNSNSMSANNYTLPGKSNLFGATTNNATNIFAQGNISAVGNNTGNNMGNTTSTNLFSNNNANNIFTNSTNSSNIFGSTSNSASLFNSSNNANTNNQSSPVAGNTTLFGSSATNSFLNNAASISKDTSLFANNTKNNLFSTTATNNIFGTQQNSNELLNKRNGLAMNSLATTGFGNSTNSNVMNANGMNAFANIFGNTSINTTNSNVSNANSVLNKSGMHMFGNNTASASTGGIFGNTSNSFLNNANNNMSNNMNNNNNMSNNNMSNNMNNNNMNMNRYNGSSGNTNVFGVLGKPGNTLNNNTNPFGNNSSSNLFTGNAANQASNLFASGATTGTTNMFGNNNNSFSNNNNNSFNSNNTISNNNSNVNKAGNTFGLSSNANQFGGNNSSGGTSGLFFSGGNTNSGSSLFGSNNNINSSSSNLFGRNETSFNTGNNSMLNKSPVSNSNSLFGNPGNSMNTSGMANNRNINSTGVFGSMNRQNNTPTNNFVNNNIFPTNTNNNFLSSKTQPFTSNCDPTKITNNANFFSAASTNNGSNNTNRNNGLFGMNNSFSSLAGTSGLNSNNNCSGIFENKLSGNASNSNLFGKSGNNMSNSSFNSNGMFNTNQTTSFWEKANSTNILNNSFSSKMNTNASSSNLFNSSAPFGNNTNANANANVNTNANYNMNSNMNSNVNTFTKSGFFGATPATLSDGNKNVNSNAHIFDSSRSGSNTNLFGSSGMGMNSFGSNLNNTNMHGGGIGGSTSNNNFLGNGNKLLGSTNTFGCNTNANNASVNNINSNLFMNNAHMQNSNTNRSNPFVNATADNRASSNLFSKNNIANSSFMNNTSTGNTATATTASTGLFSNQPNSFTQNNRTNTSIFGLGNSNNNSSNSKNNMFQNSTFLSGRHDVVNTNSSTNMNTNLNTQAFNMQNNQNMFQQNAASKPTTRDMAGGFFR